MTTIEQLQDRIAELEVKVAAKRAFDWPEIKEKVEALEKQLDFMTEQHRAALEAEQLRFNQLSASQSRIAELESEVSEQCRLNGMGSEREYVLQGKVAELEVENARLKDLAVTGAQRIIDAANKLDPYAKFKIAQALGKTVLHYESEHDEWFVHSGKFFSSPDYYRVEGE